MNTTNLWETQSIILDIKKIKDYHFFLFYSFLGSLQFHSMGPSGHAKSFGSDNFHFEMAWLDRGSFIQHV